MRISPGQSQGTPVEPPSIPAKQASAPTPSLAAGNDEKSAENGASSAVTNLQRQTDVTLRRDTNGRVYYVVSDAKSGQEILEVPPKALRDVSQGIADYLKAAESKASSHVKVKA